MEEENNKKRKSLNSENVGIANKSFVNIVSPNQKNNAASRNNNEKVEVQIFDTNARASFKMMESVEELGETKSLMYSRPEVMCKSLGGGIDLIWVDQGSNEAFIHPLNVALFGDGNGKKAEEGCESLKKNTNIFASVPRRISKEVNKAMMKQDLKDESKHYKKTYFIRLSGRSSNEENLLHCAVAFVRYVSSLRLLFIESNQ